VSRWFVTASTSLAELATNSNQDGAHYSTQLRIHPDPSGVLASREAGPGLANQFINGQILVDNKYSIHGVPGKTAVAGLTPFMETLLEIGQSLVYISTLIFPKYRRIDLPSNRKQTQELNGQATLGSWKNLGT
jgi:hypothetical protein